MSDKYRYQQVNEAGEVTNSEASLELVANPGTVTYLRIEKLVISVFKAAAGGGGIVRVQDTLGNNIFTVSADGVGVFPMDWGDEGIEVGPNAGIQVITAGANQTQASASVALAGHKTFRTA